MNHWIEIIIIIMLTIKVKTAIRWRKNGGSIIVLTALMIMIMNSLIMVADGCRCGQQLGRFCGDRLNQCISNIVYQCDSIGREPIQITDCQDTGCTMSSGQALCWQKLTASILVN